MINAAVAMELARRAPWVEMRVELDAASGTKRFWNGEGIRRTVSGDYIGLGRLGSVSSLEQPMRGAAPSVSLILSGLDNAAPAYLLSAQSEIVGRAARIILAVYRHPPPPMLSPREVEFVGAVTLFSGVMGVPKYAYATEGDPPVIRHTITIPVEDALGAERNRVRGPLYTDADQQRRYPGDRGLERIQRGATQTVDWPYQVVT